MSLKFLPGSTKAEKEGIMIRDGSKGVQGESSSSISNLSFTYGYSYIYNGRCTYIVSLEYYAQTSCCRFWRRRRRSSVPRCTEAYLSSACKYFILLCTCTLHSALVVRYLLPKVHRFSIFVPQLEPRWKTLLLLFDLIKIRNLR